MEIQPLCLYGWTSRREIHQKILIFSLKNSDKMYAMTIDKSKIKILIVDDDVNYVNQLYGRLQSQGYDTSVAFNPLDAKSLLFKFPFQIVFLDCLMPEMNGYSFAEEVSKVFGSSIKFILMSSVFRKHDVAYMESKNIFSMLEKPIEDDILKKEIDRVIQSFLSSEKNKSLISEFFEEKHSIKFLLKKFEKESYVNQGEVLFLFFHLLLNKGNFNFTLSCEKGKKANIVFKNGSVNHYETNEGKYAWDFLENKKLFEPKELKSLIQSHGVEIMSYLVDHSLISPHHYFNYRKSSVLKSIEYFTNQPRVRVHLEKRSEEDHLQNKQMYENVENILTSYFVQNLVPFIEKGMNKRIFNRFKNSFKDYKIVVQDDQKLHWMTQSIPLLNLFNQKDEPFVNGEDLNKFFKSFSNSNQDRVVKGLFFLMLQGVVSLERNKLLHLDKIYSKRYQFLKDYLKSLSINKIFEILGCKDVSDKSTVQKVYHHYMKMNHIDKFQGYSERLRISIKQCNQIISNAYDTVMNDEKLNIYVQSVNDKEVTGLIEIKKYKNDLVQHVKYQRYERAERLLKDIKFKLKDQNAQVQKDMKDNLLMWEFILEIQKSQYKIDPCDLSFMEKRVRKMNKHKVSLDVYFYLFSLFRKCDSKYALALRHCKRSLDVNENFDLSNILAIELNQMNKKSFADWKTLLTDKKKIS